MENKVLSLKNLDEVVEYWEQCLAKLDAIPDMDVAWLMVDVFSNSHIDDWYYADGSLFAEIIELAADLEHAAYYSEKSEMRSSMWQQMKNMISEMKKTELAHN